MTNETREFISSLMDGEVTSESSRFLMRRLASDEDMCSKWSRYHLVRDCLRNQQGSVAQTDLRARVSAAISDDGPVQSRARVLSASWLKPVGGMAIAASVALMAVVAIGPSGDLGGPVPTGHLEAEALDSFTSPQSLTPAPYSQEASFLGKSNQPENRFNSYLIRHYQATEGSGAGGFVRFVPIILNQEQAAANSERSETDNTETSVEIVEEQQK